MKGNATSVYSAYPASRIAGERRRRFKGCGGLGLNTRECGGGAVPTAIGRIDGGACYTGGAMSRQ